MDAIQVSLPKFSKPFSILASWELDGWATLKLVGQQLFHPLLFFMFLSHVVVLQDALVSHSSRSSRSNTSSPISSSTLTTVLRCDLYPVAISKDTFSTFLCKIMTPWTISTFSALCSHFLHSFSSLPSFSSAGVVQVNHSIKIGWSLSCYLLYVGCLCYKGKRTIKEEKARNKVSPASEEDIQVSKIIITRKEE